MNTVLSLTRAERTWQCTAEWLIAAGVTSVFALPDDDMIAARALEAAGIEVRWTLSQRTLVHMAAGVALAHGRPAVCLIGRGPAVAASVPALLEAQHSHAPVLVLATGTASSLEYRRAFQHVNALDLVRPVTVWSARVEEPEDLGAVLAEAWARTTDGAGGPVFVEISDDVLAAQNSAPCQPMSMSEAGRLLQASQQPVVILGGGMPAGARMRLVAFAESLGAAVLSTASGRGVFPEAHPAYLGLSGLYMSSPVADLISQADIVLTLGSALEETAMWGMPKQATWLQINISVSGINYSVPGGYVLGDATAELPPIEPSPRLSWQGVINAVRSELGSYVESSRTAAALSELASVVPDNTVVVHENGLHDMWTYHFPAWSVPAQGTDIAPSEMTTLGFGAAAALGIAVAGENPVVAFVGDGAFATILGELTQFFDDELHLLYVVFDDGGLGWLDHEATRTGARSSFRWRSPLTLLQGSDALIEPNCEADDASAVHRAVARMREGRVTVLRLPCSTDDLPPFLTSNQGSA